MSHLLVIELPGGDDTDILVAALALGHRVSFLTADLAHYRQQREVARYLAGAEAVIDAGDFALPVLLRRLAALHRIARFDAVLCLQDLRIVEAAEIAAALGLRHISPETARLTRDKAAVRRRLAGAGFAQPPFARVTGAEELVAAIAAMGLPVVVKPVDGFGSQNIFALRTANDLALLASMPQIIADGPGAYGLGVAAAGAMLVERLLEGQLVGCDTMTADGRHVLLGVNEKLFFPQPSFAIRGGCFTVNMGQFAAIEACCFAMLDAIGFDQGAAHIELMLSAEGPQLIEINPRLVGARIGRLISAARGQSVHADLVALQAEGRLPRPATALNHAVTRWLAAPRHGVLRSISVPRIAGPASAATIMARPGDRVAPPLDNADRLGCVTAWGPDRSRAEDMAERMVRETDVILAN